MRRSLFFAVYLLVATAILVELTFRVVFSFEAGPRVLLYGTPWQRQLIDDRSADEVYAEFEEERASWNEAEYAMDSVSEHHNELGGYFKYFPYEVKQYRDVDTGEFVDVKINNHGFRGEDFEIEKPEGVTRVVTLGASSTFGFFNPEDGIYPPLTEMTLNRDCEGAEYEVINLGIPHLVADQIRTLLLREGLPLRPDVVTFYEGRNDADRVHPMEFLEGVDTEDGGGSTLRAVWKDLSDTFVAARFADSLLEARLAVPEALSNIEHVREVGERTSAAFMADIEAIRRLCEENGILFIVISQQANSKSWFGLPERKRAELEGVSYDDEVAQVRKRLEQGKTLSGYEFNFLIHDYLMQDLEGWALREGIPYVDFHEILGGQRDHMISYAHVDTYANTLLAEALAEEILDQTCPDRQGRIAEENGSGPTDRGDLDFQQPENPD